MPKRFTDSVIYEIDGDTTIMHFSRDRFAIIDTADLETAMGFRWAMDRDGYVTTSHYAAHGEYSGTKSLHRLLFGDVSEGFVVDHVNGIPADNRRLNLRLATRSENGRNRSPDRGKAYKGIQLLKKGKWKAHIHLGEFDTAEEAARAYDRAAVVLFGEFARPNFGQSAAKPPCHGEGSTTSSNERRPQVGAEAGSSLRLAV